LSSPAILVEGLGKQFRIGARIRQADTLGETLAIAASRQLGRLRGLFRQGSQRDTRGIEKFWALRDVSFEVQPGEVLGIIGRNGSGKSTLLKILSRITPPTEGQATIAGRVGSLLEIGTGFHSELTGRENIFLSGTILGMKRYEINERFDEIVAFSGVEQFIDTPVKHYSSGMYLRLAFAVAAHLRSEILLIDEVLAVGDAVFQKKCMNKMSEVAQEGRTVLFVSHNLGAISRLCSCGLLLEAGNVIARGSVGEVVSTYGQLVAAREDEESTEQREEIGVYGLKVASAVSSIVPSTSLTFKFRLQVVSAFWNVFIQLGIMTHEGLNLVLEAVDSERFPELRQPGCYDVEVIFPALWLRPQSYTSRIKIIAHPESGATKRFYSDWLEFAVDGGSEVEGVSSRILAPQAEWCLRELGQKVVEP
jgi:lipopolysaccharide transport system ATP-binding protein